MNVTSKPRSVRGPLFGGLLAAFFLVAIACEVTPQEQGGSLKTMQSLNQKLKLQLEQLSATLTEAIDNAEGLSTQERELARKREALSQEISRLLKEVKQLEQKKTDLTRDVESKQQELTAMTGHLDGLKAEHKSFKLVVDRLLQEGKQSQAQSTTLETSQKQVKSLEGRVQTLGQKLDRQGAALDKLRARDQRSAQRIEALAAHLATFSKLYGDLPRDVEEGLKSQAGKTRVIAFFATQGNFLAQLATLKTKKELDAYLFPPAKPPR